jgi:hypothetical protein
MDNNIKKETALSETSWFPHDLDCTTDLKLAAFINTHGASGYGIYWHIVELLHAEPDSQLPIRPYVLEGIAGKMKVEPNYVQTIIEACIKYELFDQKGDFFLCQRVFRNKERKDHIRTIRIAHGRKGGLAKASKSLANGKQMLSKTVAKPTRGEERRGEQLLSCSSDTPQTQQASDQAANSATQALLGGLVSEWPCSEQEKKIYQGLVEKIPQSNFHLIQRDFESGIVEMLKSGETTLNEFLNAYQSEH